MSQKTRSLSCHMNTHCLSVRSKNACLSRSFCTSASDHPRLSFSSAILTSFFLLSRILVHLRKSEMNTWADKSTRIAILPGMYAGASLGWKISLPTMLPRPNVTIVMALTVFCEGLWFCVNCVIIVMFLTFLV